MQLRIKTLYRKKITKIINILWGLQLLTAAGLGGSTTFSIKGMTIFKCSRFPYLFFNVVAPLKFNTATMCTVTHLPIFSAAFWFPILLFELFLFSLAFRVAWYNHKHLGNWRGASLLHIVLRDNFNYFFLCVRLVSLVKSPTR